MALTAPGYVNKAEIEAGVRAVERTFASEVVRIVYSFGEDITETPTLFFRIIVTDDAAEPISRLMDLVRRVPIALMNEVRTFENGLHSTFSFRTVSEQQKLQDPDWN